MIIEAFAKYLHAADPATPAPTVLARWLWERLTTPVETVEDKVLRSEIALELAGKRRMRQHELLATTPGYFFTAQSDSGRRLLKALSDYASSYEQQKWSRWVHKVKASDFNGLYNGE